MRNIKTSPGNVPWLEILLVIVGLCLVCQWFHFIPTFWPELIDLGNMQLWSHHHWRGFIVAILLVLGSVRFVPQVYQQYLGRNSHQSSCSKELAVLDDIAPQQTVLCEPSERTGSGV
jgi:hypothetical protein